MSRRTHNKEAEFQGEIELVRLDANDETLLTQNIDQTTSNGYVFYGKEDTQFQYLLDLYVKSTTHGAIVNSLSFMMYGDGLNVEDIIDPKDNKKALKDWNIFGNATFQVTKDDIFHMPVNFIRAEPIDPNTGRVEWFQFSTDFTDNKSENVRFPAWSEDWKPTDEFPSAIYYVKTYTPNASFYYGLPSFQSALSYMEQEVNVAKFLNHYIKNNFSVNVLVNFNNGTTDPESRKKNVKSIKQKFTGTEGDTIIVAHNKSKEHAATVETVTVPNGSEQYSYMTQNARSQIIVGHQIVTPLLVGIRDDATGFSSNGEELIQGRLLLEEMKITPNQELFADAFNAIKGRTDIEYISSAKELEVKEEIASAPIEPIELKKVTPQLADALIELGLDEPKGFYLFDESVDNSDDELDLRLSYEEDVKLASSGVAIPNAQSEMDTEDIILRYVYSGSIIGQRSFCNKVIAAKKQYRREDLERMGDNPTVNPGFGIAGAATYSIYKYKGGPNCQHYWMRKIYVKQGVKVDVNSPLAKSISVAEARRKGYEIKPQPVEVGRKPTNMANNGYYK